MELRYSKHFLRQYSAAPASVRESSIRRAATCCRTCGTRRFVPKKYDEAAGIWQARVNLDWRFYFSIAGDEYHLHDIKPHPK
jgi:hypothetical protein